MSDFNSTAYKNEYNTTAYDRVSLMLPKGMRDELKAMCKAKGESVNSFINRAIIALIEKEEEQV